VIEALRYKPEGHGVNTQRCHWNFSLTKSFCPHYGPQVNSASNRNEFQEYFLEDKGCRCWWPHHLHVLIVLKFGSLSLSEPSRPDQACTGIALPFTCINWLCVTLLHSRRILVVIICVRFTLVSYIWCFQVTKVVITLAVVVCLHVCALVFIRDICYLCALCVLLFLLVCALWQINYRIWLPENGNLKRLCVCIYCFRNREIQVSKL